jgi:hypothetical protein
VDEKVNVVALCFCLCVYFPYTIFDFVNYNDFVGKSHFDTISVIGVLFNGVAKGSHLEFMILPLLLHLEYFFLTSLLGFFLLAIMLLLALQIKKR